MAWAVYLSDLGSCKINILKRCPADIQRRHTHTNTHTQRGRLWHGIKLRPTLDLDGIQSNAKAALAVVVVLQLTWQFSRRQLRAF